MLTFKDLKTQTAILLDQLTDIGTGNAGDLQIANAIAQAHELRLMKERWSFMLWGTPQSVQFKSGIQNYTLHPLAAILTDFTNDTAKMRMAETPTRARFKVGVQDDRFHFEMVQESPVQLPFATGKLTVVGSATITYMDTSGNLLTEVVANGVTTANVDTVVNVTKNDVNPLTITDSAAKQILALTGTVYGASYPQIRLFSLGQTETGLYRFYRRPRTLSNDNDIPEIPYPFSRVLIYDALLEIATYNDSTPPQYWLQKQGEWDLLLRQTYQEGEMEGSEGRTVIESDQYEG